MIRSLIYVLIILAAGLAMFGLWHTWPERADMVRMVWQQAVTPGPLSRSHTALENKCSACHTPVKGVEPRLCISCHADNRALLQRQPTAFHANVQTCIGCHSEHVGKDRMPTVMDHGQIPVTQVAAVPELPTGTLSDQELKLATRLGVAAALLTGTQSDAAPAQDWYAVAPRAPRNTAHTNVGQVELACVACHGTKDRHQGRFGTACASCHATDRWTVSEFVHPSPRSAQCVQCHQAPPSHYMEHFSMVSASLARQPKAKVNQCFACHQTTSWNDIKGSGWTKHH
jgi:hypothetical protein